MARFIDEYAPDELPGYPCISAPRFSTQIVVADSGAEQVNRRWAHPLHTFTLPQAVRKYEHYAAVAEHWYAMGGPYHTWPFRDPLDFASVKLTYPNQLPQISATDQVIGTGDGVTRTFQLTKTYRRGTQSYARNIYLPIVSTVRVAVAGVELGRTDSPTLWSVTRQGGVVTFTTAPALGASITAGFFFDVPVRFEADDTFGGIVRNWQVAGFSDITLVEVPLCTEDTD